MMDTPNPTWAPPLTGLLVSIHMRVRTLRFVSLAALLLLFAGAILANETDGVLRAIGIAVWALAVAIEFLAWYFIVKAERAARRAVNSLRDDPYKPHPGPLF